MTLRGLTFDAYGTLFDVYSIAQRAEQLFPESGAQISMLWRQKQVEYSQLSALSDPSPGGSRYYRPFRELTEAALRYSLQRLALPFTDGQVLSPARHKTTGVGGIASAPPNNDHPSLRLGSARLRRPENRSDDLSDEKSGLETPTHPFPDS